MVFEAIAANQPFLSRFLAVFEPKSSSWRSSDSRGPKAFFGLKAHKNWSKHNVGNAYVQILTWFLDVIRVFMNRFSSVSRAFLEFRKFEFFRFLVFLSKKKWKYLVIAYVRRNTNSRLKYEGQKCLTSIRTGPYSSGSLRSRAKYRSLRITFTTLLHTSSSVLRINGIIYM